MGRMKKKFESGEATAFMSRNQAIKKLQLSLADFRRLCILKGIYPHEPKHKKRVGRGNTAPKTYYFVKDIQFLSHEPIIWKFRETKHYVRRLKKALEKNNTEAVKRIRGNKPKYKLHHIVRERYPMFSDAIRDLEDCLSMCFLFATLPKTSRTFTEHIFKARKLTVEFLHYVIASKSLRKVYVSIKGIYYQVEILNETITWVQPHKLGYEAPTEVDFKIMQTFVEFYITMLGFVNYKLYHTLNLHYPPQLEDGFTENDFDEEMTRKERVEEKLASLSQNVMSIDAGGGEDDAEIDDFPLADPDNPDHIEQARVEAEQHKKFLSLFKGQKFFLNRETPQESLTFVIRSFGGQVSWSKTDAQGATYEETDQTITHQVVDRPSKSMATKYISRCYVQPQWVYDCVNTKKLLPVNDYVIDAVLPPHLSPFVEEQEDDYIPPERLALLSRQNDGEDSGMGEEDDDKAEADQDEDDEAEEEEEEDEDSEQEVEEETKRSKQRDVKHKQTHESKVKTKKLKDEHNTSAMSVERGKMQEEDVERKRSRQMAEERKLAEMTIPKKKKRMYDRVVAARNKKKQEKRILTEKRCSIEKAKRNGRKETLI
ncbi:pescadillo homolog isoform X2 [Ylistrum balloti]|uniref:pescadillo homolog isoform X2 n=1 Tax=Ylistrum balloti TaxID=509963 RepID=UPI002905EF74|nr:pescadillo homolog isoform X2 [Ylistrum balloti]